MPVESGRDKAARFLAQSVQRDQLSQAYLLIGPQGSGKTSLAWDFAQHLLCAEGGCGSCEDCQRVQRRSHPDVHVLAPQGVKGYVIEQVRDLVRDSALAPIQASAKLYLLQRCELLQDAAANALLKTLEEPPANTYFVLTARTREAILPTILSRCTVLELGSAPADEALVELMRQTGAKPERALGALAICGGSVQRACAFLASPARLALWDRAAATMESLLGADDLQLLQDAKDLVTAARAPLEDVSAQHEEQLEEGGDYLSRSALRSLGEQQKRELASQEREFLGELLACIRSWLGDGLSLAVGAPRALANTRSAAALRQLASQLPSQNFVNALKSVDLAGKRIAYGVTPQLAVEALLFDLRKVLSCPK